MKRISFFSIAFLLASVFSFDHALADIKLPAIFCDNMVLQQQTEVAIWGKASNNAVVRVSTSWNGKSYSIKATDDGSWKLKVATPKAGGPYDITINDGKSVKLKNVLIGEVWVCSGQSNMEMPMKGLFNQPLIGGLDAIALSTNSNIRLFTVKKAISIEPLDNFIGDWKSCIPENVSEFSAVAYYYGLMLNKTLNVPIGLISTTWGGTRIEPWMSEMGCRNFDWVKLPDKKSAESVTRQTPTAIFNSMINPMVGYGIRGAIWYQGESNRIEYKEYEKLLPGMITNWRSLWGIGDFPFYYVQIAPYNYGTNVVNSAFLREAQLKASIVIPNIGMACIMDLGEQDGIHPSNKEPVAKRLAFLALSQTYGMKGINGQSPVLKEMKVTDGLVKLTFNNAPLGLTSFGKELSCFEIAGENKIFYPAKAYIIGDGVTLLSQKVLKPVAVRYAFKDFVVGDLFSSDGLPVSSFRTDDWD